MAIAKITLIGMYQYMNDQNDPLFKNLTVPVGMDRNKLIDAILYKGAEFGVVYADPYFMQSMIKIWSDRYYHTLDRWSKALAIEYDPLENYDRREEWTDAGSRSKTGNSTRAGTDIGSVNRQNTGSSSDMSTSGSSENNINSNKVSQTTASNKTNEQSDEHKVSAYDATTYQAKDRNDIDGKNGDITASQTGSNGESSIEGQTHNVEQHQTSDSQTNEDRRVTAEQSNDNEEEGHVASHTGRLHGNIGIVSSQQMLIQEIDVARFNLYDEAACLFLNEFCIYVY